MSPIGIIEREGQDNSASFRVSGDIIVSQDKQSEDVSLLFSDELETDKIVEIREARRRVRGNNDLDEAKITLASDKDGMVIFNSREIREATLDLKKGAILLINQRNQSAR